MAQHNEPSDLRHRLVEVPGGRIHLVEQGTGPLVLLVHGFPESWYSWRHQLPALAAAGYRAVAIDVRGYGRSSKPGEVEAYRMLDLVATTSPSCAPWARRPRWSSATTGAPPSPPTSALLRPDVFRAVGLLSVPYAPPGGTRPTDVFGQIGGPRSSTSPTSRSPAAPRRRSSPMSGAGSRASTPASPPTPCPPATAARTSSPPAARLRDRFPAKEPPRLADRGRPRRLRRRVRAHRHDRRLNRYRNIDRDWEDLAAWTRAPIKQPSLFIGGELDASTTWMADAIDAYPTTLPGLSASHLLEGCGHWIQQERPEEVNGLLIDWLRSLSR